MRGKKQLLNYLSHFKLTERELTLVWRDIRRAADAAAIGGASEKEWNAYLEVEHAIEGKCLIWYGKKPTDYLNREGADELPAIYKKIFSRKKAR